MINFKADNTQKKSMKAKNKNDRNITVKEIRFYLSLLFNLILIS